MNKPDLVERVNPRTGETVWINRMFADEGHWLDPNGPLTAEDISEICGGDVDGAVRDLLRAVINTQHHTVEKLSGAA